MKLLVMLSKRNLLFWMTMGIVFIFGIGFLDYRTGSELAFSLFYLMPIVLVTWFVGRNPGIVISIFCAITWAAADHLGGQVYSQPFIQYWNAAIRFGFFTIITMLLPALKELHRERELSRNDYLTGAASRRHFYELLASEVARSQRYNHPFTLAYFDLDDFKLANDHFGHKTGDEILRVVVNTVKDRLRKTDSIGRLGGDEFVILLPETGQTAAQSAVQNIHNAMMDEMKRNDWPVTFSIGVLICPAVDLTPDDLIRCADILMYSVKNNGKNAVTYAIYGEKPNLV